MHRQVGYEMVDAIARAEGISLSAVQSRALIGKGRICGTPVLLAKPQTYMNLSGESVAPLASYFKIPTQRVLVMYDDLDLATGTLKLLPKGGHGGHNGMRSIIQHLKSSKDFPRIRIGIGRPPGSMEAAAYVLQKFDKTSRELVNLSVERGVSVLRMIMEEGLEKAVSSSNPSKSRATLDSKL
eukprot:SM000010S04193  [mRNA]  locus=s10:144289:146209:- [translate_table: standard]